MTLALLSLLLLSCSLRKYDNESCSTDSECQQNFGFGSSCSADGFCDLALPNSRCDALLPTDIFDNPIAYINSYPIGVLFDSSADIAKISAVALAIKEVQSRGGLDEQEIIAIQCNYQDDLDGSFGDGLTGQDAVKFGTEYLTDTLKIPLIIGPAGSDDSIAAYDTVKSRDAVLISPSATSESLSIIDGTQKSDESPGMFWRTVGSDREQAQILAAHIERTLESNPNNEIAIIHQKSSYGEGFANTLDETFSLNGEIDTIRLPFDDVSEEPWANIDPEEDDLTGIAFISSDIADIISFILHMDSDTTGRFDDLLFFLPDAAAKDLLLTETDGVSETIYGRIRGSRPSLPSGIIFDNFAASYEAYTGTTAQVSVFSAFSYDATWIGLYGLIWAHYQEDPSSGASIARGLRKLSDTSGMGIPISLSSWTDVMINFEEGSGIDVSGASGELDFDSTTEETTNNIEIWAIEGSPGAADFTVLETCDPSGNICE